MEHTRRHSTKPLRVKLDPFEIDPRAAFVDKVCSLMVEARYNPTRTAKLIVTLSDGPTIDSAVFLDVTDQGLFPSYPVAEMVNCFAPIDIALDICPASRNLLSDAYVEKHGEEELINIEELLAEMCSKPTDRPVRPPP